MGYTTRELVTIAIFGTVWGALEMTLGSLLHVLNVPQAGVVMTTIGIIILLTGHTFVPKRWAVVMMGVTTAFVKMFSLGGIVLNPMLAIVMEALLVEIGLCTGKPRRSRFVLAAVLGSSWNFIHPFLTQGLLAGWGIVRVYGWLVQSGARLLGLPPDYGWLIFALLLGIKVVAGLVAGHLGWEVAGAVRQRMGELSSIEGTFSK